MAKPGKQAKKPAAKKPVAKKPAAKRAAEKKPATKKPAAKKPVTKQPAKTPAAKQARPRPPHDGATYLDGRPIMSKRALRELERPVPVPATAKQAELLAAIIANPEDKRARLVYADLLQDQGDPRGELIILQCTRADLAPDDPRAAELLAREAELFKKHKKAWTAFGATSGARWEYRRGFIEKASCDADALYLFGNIIFGLEPIEELNVWKIDESSVSIEGSKLAPVLERPLHHIRRLSLARSELTEADVVALAGTGSLGSVELLDLTNTNLGARGAELLASARSLPKLRELRIGNCFVGDAGIAALAASTTLVLERLIAPRNELTAAAGEAIANATWASQLTHLDLSTNDLRGVEAFARSPRLTKLRSLALEYNLLDAATPELVLSSPHLMKLEHLDLSSNLDRAGRDRLRAAFGDRLRI
jgi:uncharacterized protein (TIGR02996 family)